LSTIEILRAFRFRTRETGHQAALFWEYSRIARSAWNWGVKTCREEYEAAVEQAKEEDDYVEKQDKKGETYKKWNTKGRMPIVSPGDVPDGVPKSFGGRLYAAFLEHHKLDYRSKREGTADPESHPYPHLLPVYSHVYAYPLQNVAKAYSAFWNGRKAGRDSGKPLLKTWKPVGKRARRRWGVRRERNPSFGLQVKGRQILRAQPTCPKCGVKADDLQELHCPACGEKKPAYIELPAMLGLGPIKVWDDLTKVRGRPVQATIRREGEHWYISLSCKIQIEPKKPTGQVIGVDLGVNSIVTLWSDEELDTSRLARRLKGLTYDQEELIADLDGAFSMNERISELQRELPTLTVGEKDELAILIRRRNHRHRIRRIKQAVEDSITVTIEDEGVLTQLLPPLPLERKQRRLARMQRQKKRKQRGSKRMKRAELAISRLHERVRRQRADYLHKLSRWLDEEGRVVVMEGFDVKKLVQHGVKKHMKGKRKRARRRKILDIAWGELRFRTEYKGVERGAELVICEKFKATDRPCYICGTLNKSPPTTSEYRCAGCGNVTTRQRNTARLLEGFGRGDSPESTPGHGGTNGVDPKALGPGSAGVDPTGKDRVTGKKRNGSKRSPGSRTSSDNTAARGAAPKPRRAAKRKKRSRKGGG